MIDEFLKYAELVGVKTPYDEASPHQRRKIIPVPSVSEIETYLSNVSNGQKIENANIVIRSPKGTGTGECKHEKDQYLIPLQIPEDSEDLIVKPKRVKPKKGEPIFIPAGTGYAIPENKGSKDRITVVCMMRDWYA